MNTWRSLLWKEWREQRAVGLAILAVLVLVPILTSISDFGELRFGLSGTALFALPMFAIFIGMGIASGEHSRKTVPFLQALPSETWKAAASKLIIGFLTFAVPLMISFTLFFCYWSYFNPSSGLGLSLGGRSVWGIPSPILSRALSSVLMPTSLLIWTVAVGKNRKDEISAGALAIAIGAAAYCTLLGLFWMLSKITSDPSYMRQEGWLHPLAACLPGLCGFVSYHNGATGLDGVSWFSHFGPYLIVSIVTHALLIWRFLKGYGCPARKFPEVSLPLNKRPQSDWLSPPRRSENAAIAWKVWRELAPMLAVGVMIAAVLTLLTRIDSSQVDWRNQFFSIWVPIGGFVAVALGIGVFREDLEPGLHIFWRSRPSSIAGWFWVKFSLAAGMLLAIWLVTAWLQTRYVMDSHSENAAIAGEPVLGGWEETYRMWASIIGVMLVHLGLYVGAVLFMVLVRRPIFAAVMDVGLMFGGIYCIDRIGRLSGLQAGSTAAIFLAIFLVGTGLIGVIAAAWQAFKKDWSLENWLG